MLHLFPFISAHFERFPNATGHSEQHGCNTTTQFCRLRSADFQGAFSNGGLAMTATSTRRAILAGTAALPALSLPAIAQTDPIFAALERYREAHAACVAAYAACEGTAYPSAKAREDHATDLHETDSELMVNLIEMTPTTAAGCAAVLRQVEQFLAWSGAEPLFDSWCDAFKNPGATLLGRIADALDRA
jgi:hypothetical protein